MSYLSAKGKAQIQDSRELLITSNIQTATAYQRVFAFIIIYSITDSLRTMKYQKNNYLYNIQILNAGVNLKNIGC